MILINLLPQEYRIREVTKIKIPYKLISIFVFSAFVVFCLYNLFHRVQMTDQNRLLESRWKTLIQPNLEAEQLEMELGSAVLSEVNFYDTYVDPPLETARIINLVSDLIPKSLTLLDMSFERRGSEFQLLLDGFSESPHRESKLVEIQNYSNGLKDYLETFVKPQVQMPGMATGQLVEAEVTTSIKEGPAMQGVITEFKIRLETPNFSKDKDKR